MITRAVYNLLKQGFREDDRKIEEYRKIEVKVNPIDHASGSAWVKFGDTEVLAGVKMDVGEPFPDTPDEGALISNVEFTPIAAPEFEPGPPSNTAIELARVVDRGIREHGLDFESLCIKPKEKIWMVNLDIYPINSDGNLFDAAALAALIALKNARIPKYDEKEEKVYHEEFTSKKLKFKDEPILITTYKIGDLCLLDPTKKEEEQIDARLSFAITKDGDICAIQKGEEGTFSEEEIEQAIKRSQKFAKELRKYVD